MYINKQKKEKKENLKNNDNNHLNNGVMLVLFFFFTIPSFLRAVIFFTFSDGRKKTFWVAMITQYAYGVSVWREYIKVVAVA